MVKRLVSLVLVIATSLALGQALEQMVDFAVEESLYAMGNLHMKEISNGTYDRVWETKTATQACQSNWSRTVRSVDDAAEVVPDIDDHVSYVRATTDGGFLVRLSFSDMVTMFFQKSSESESMEDDCDAQEGFLSARCVKKNIARSMMQKDTGSFLARESFLRQFIIVEGALGNKLLFPSTNRQKRSQEVPTFAADFVRTLMSVFRNDSYGWTEDDVQKDDDPTGEKNWFAKETYPKRFLQSVTEETLSDDEFLPNSFGQMVLANFQGQSFKKILAELEVEAQPTSPAPSRVRRQVTFRTLGQYDQEGRERTSFVNYYSKEFLTKYMCFHGKPDKFYRSIKLFGDHLYLADDEARQAAFLVSDRYPPSMETFDGMRYITVGEILQISMDREEAIRRARLVLGLGAARINLSMNFMDDAAHREQKGIDDFAYYPNIWNTDVKPPPLAKLTRIMQAFSYGVQPREDTAQVVAARVALYFRHLLTRALTISQEEQKHGSSSTPQLSLNVHHLLTALKSDPHKQQHLYKTLDKIHRLDTFYRAF